MEIRVFFAIIASMLTGWSKPNKQIQFKPLETMPKPHFALTAYLCLLLASCNPQADRPQLPVVSLHTRFGELKLILHSQTPKHKARFLELVRTQAYDSTTINRVVPEFRMRGGDILQKPKRQFMPKIPAEISPDLFHRKGALVAVRKMGASNPKRQSDGSRFFLVLGRKHKPEEIEELALKENYRVLAPLMKQLLDSSQYGHLKDTVQRFQQRQDAAGLTNWIISQSELIEREFGEQPLLSFSERQIKVYEEEGGLPSLDGKYTVFGQVVEGLHVLDSMAKAEVNQLHEPKNPIYLEATLVMLPESEYIQKYRQWLSSPTADSLARNHVAQ